MLSEESVSKAIGSLASPVDIVINNAGLFSADETLSTLNFPEQASVKVRVRLSTLNFPEQARVRVRVKVRVRVRVRGG